MTRQIEVVRHIKARREDVYAMFADSDRLGSLPGVRVTVIRPGEGARDGVGMRRRISFGPGLHLIEHVVSLDAPHAFGYLIPEARPSFRHDSGLITFEAVDGGTRVVWASAFGRPAGPLTPVVERIAAQAARAGFAFALQLINRALAG